MSDIRTRLLATVGGSEERFAGMFSLRTFSPDRLALTELNDGENSILNALTVLGENGATPEQAEEWTAGYLKRWAAYQYAGSRTANWMITGPARFPVERNRKRMETEHKRLEELLEYEKGASEWMRRRQRAAERREATANDEGGHKEKVVNGIQVVLNKTLDRVQIIFPDKPSDEERAILKSYAFRWAPSVGAWQRQLTQNGVWAAEGAIKKIVDLAA